MMNTYECKQCGMAVKATCGNCDIPLENSVIQLADGSQVQVSKCPECEGKIKSPMCCGDDMSCKV